MSEDARGLWGALAERPAHCRLRMDGAEELTVATRLIEDAEGRSTWVVDRVYRAPSGLYLIARHARTVDQEVEDVTFWAGRDAAELVAHLRSGGAIDPGMVETLGRGGIEIGVEPDDEEED